MKYSFEVLKHGFKDYEVVIHAVSSTGVDCIVHRNDHQSEWGAVGYARSWVKSQLRSRDGNPERVHYEEIEA